ncbi:hypothetical protein M758_8G070300 [Ceratodon purpureus]|nr:hypothetical protein M758_8G070300 [Ceratodon purpureus]
MAARVAHFVLVLCFVNAGSVVSVQQSNPYGRHGYMGRQLKQAAPGGGNSVTITEACAATHFPASCLQALNGDPRSASAVPRELVAIAIGVAHSYATTSEADAATLAAQVGGAGNVNLTSVSRMCSEVTDLASFHIQNSQNAVNGPLLNDVQAWLSGALTFTTDCSAGLGQVSSVLPFVGEMKGRLDASQEMISNALAMTDALVNYGDNTALWKPPPLSKDQMLFVDASFALKHDLHSAKKLPHWLSARDHNLLRGRLDVAPSVTVDLASPFSSIQRAVDLAPDWSGPRYIIYIKAGVYNEVVRIPKHKTNLMFMGDGSDKTIITGSMSDSQVGMITWATATVAVSGQGFIARGITFQNTAGPDGRQAVALRVNSDQSAFQSCAVVGYQDSLYTHSFRQFYKDMYISGTVDFIFGNSAAVFQNSQLVVRVGAPGATTSTLTAQGRTDSGQTTGLVFQDCAIAGTPEYLALFQANRQAHQAFLGRPWKTFSRTVFIRTYIDQIIDPSGWLPWNGNFALSTLFAAEFGTYGPGAANLNNRVTWSSQLTTPQAQAFSISSFIQGPSWLPATGIPFTP